MKILKPGEIINNAYFICKHCGCEFEADPIDYSVVAILRVSDHVTRYVNCDCPFCFQKVESSITKKE